MASLPVTGSVRRMHPSAKYGKESIVTIDEVESSEGEDERTFHNTNAAYVLPNE